MVAGRPSREGEWDLERTAERRLPPGEGGSYLLVSSGRKPDSVL